ncbi:hypothetical protein [Thiolapillus sp.]|uniref:hypothetical protein n=6 Tax=Thiolapillus sp. TaxID=2017437 RepID=UPI0025F51F05|nr:hypothetical protein [Thiolapillus sp.]
MTRTAGAQIGCQRLSRFWGLGCPKIYHEAEDTLDETSKSHIIQYGVHAKVYQDRQVFFLLLLGCQPLSTRWLLIRLYNTKPQFDR